MTRVQVGDTCRQSAIFYIFYFLFPCQTILPRDDTCPIHYKLFMLRKLQLVHVGIKSFPTLSFGAFGVNRSTGLYFLVLI